MSLEIANCPECGLAAEVTDRDWLASTDGPVEHVYTRCVQRHWFLLPAEAVTGLCARPSSEWCGPRMSIETPASR